MRQVGCRGLQIGLENHHYSMSIAIAAMAAPASDSVPELLDHRAPDGFGLDPLEHHAAHGGDIVRPKQVLQWFDSAVEFCAQVVFDRDGSRAELAERGTDATFSRAWRVPPNLAIAADFGEKLEELCTNVDTGVASTLHGGVSSAAVGRGAAGLTPLLAGVVRDARTSDRRSGSSLCP